MSSILSLSIVVKRYDRSFECTLNVHMTPSVGLPKGHLQCKIIFEDHDEENRQDRGELL